MTKAKRSDDAKAPRAPAATLRQSRAYFRAMLVAFADEGLLRLIHD